ncbi:MAG TPA: DHH family phosphoesterase [Sedimentisphaerales bacterium]|jgi:nanoRNase/pAp phosphatase (c-di-AMP/oligoRNAs hydrolase)|nr:DHH family phosphoesterase [Sedimentisphaerales bacterium]HNU27810.1 DHH family phosphoesterase [Sedimentisphaerales bacterium]
MAVAAEKTRSKLRRLTELLTGKVYLLIAMQDNPDPDSLAAAVALRRLAKSLGTLQCSIACGGTVGRGENRALVKYLDLNLRRYGEIDYGKYDLVAMVDTQPGAGNNSLHEGVLPDIVIDHHPIRRRTRTVAFTDVRSGYGATSTILVEYLIEAGITPETPLATALLYGIRSDTQDLGREASRLDIEAIEFLYPLANNRMLGAIQRGKVPRGYYQMLADALRNARVLGPAIITELGDIDNPDMIAEVADLLLRADETSWTMCTGCWDGKLLISLRTSDESNLAGKVMKHMVGRKGTGGGHPTYAGGQIPLAKGTKAEREAIEKAVEERFLQAVGAGHSPVERLVKV